MSSPSSLKSAIALAPDESGWTKLALKPLDGPTPQMIARAATRQRGTTRFIPPSRGLIPIH
jgi:hypothetical protein